MSAMDDLYKAANKHAREKLDEFLRAFSGEALAMMLVDYETGHEAPTYDPRYHQIIDAGFAKAGSKKFVEMIAELRATQDAS